MIDTLLQALKNRFERNMDRHQNQRWDHISKIILNSQSLQNILVKMEETGGEPDVVEGMFFDKKIVFCDCSVETPLGRRNLCYDDAALNERKTAKPKGSAVAMAAQVGVTLLNEAQYRFLQTLGKFDQKTSSWIQTPDSIRDLGGALFADRRYDSVFVYHNGAQSYYSSRGWRGLAIV